MRLGTCAVVLGADARDLRASDDETPFARGLPNGLQSTTARQRFLGAFGELLATRGGWSAAGSLRADRASNFDVVQTSNAVRSTPADRSEIVLSPRLGLVRALGPHANLHGSGFRAFRSPTMNELYRTGQVGQETTLANATLTSERATGYEAGVQLTSASRLPASLRATWFWTEINRPVSAVLVSQTLTTITNQRQNLGQIRSQGIEVALEFRPKGPVSATMGYQYAEATVTRFSAQPGLIGNWIPQVPRHSFTTQLRADAPRFGEFTLGVRAGGRAFDDANNQFPLEGFVAVDASAQRTLTRHLSLNLIAQNLTNHLPQVSRTPVLTLGSPIFAEAGLRLHLGGARP